MTRFINSKGEVTKSADFIDVGEDATEIEKYYNVLVFDENDVVIGTKCFDDDPTDNQIIFAIKSFPNGNHANIKEDLYII